FCADTQAAGANTWLMRFSKTVFRNIQRGPDDYRIPMDMIEVEKSNV
ncbi:MAG: hypothetical protein JRJ59_09695, partial [Deltaproteobacteria bacterium]|nr:hypothetical protein [Deltaproteobacteria bacterium]